MTKEKYNLEQGFRSLFAPWLGMADMSQNEQDKLRLDPNDAGRLSIFCREYLKPDLSGQTAIHRRLAREAAHYGYTHLDRSQLENIFDANLITIPVPQDVKNFFFILIRECFDTTQ